MPCLWRSFYALLLPDGKKGEVRESSKKLCSVGNQEALGRREIIKLDVKKTGLHWFTAAFHCRTFAMMLKCVGVRLLTDRNTITPSSEAGSHSVARECPVFHLTRSSITVAKIITPAVYPESDKPIPPSYPTH